MGIYAQLNPQRIAVAISLLSTPVESPDMIPLEVLDSSLMGKRYDAGQWVEPPAPPAPEPVWPDVIAARRYEAEVAGIVWQGHGIATDRDSQQKMSDERSAVKDGLRTDGKGWKCLDLATGAVVFRPTTNAEILELTAAAYRHVSDCFDREGQLLAAVADGSITLASLDEGWPV